ncbi:MAG: cell wall-active antibiotics response protein [Chloroflexi bacterium]|nr:cell wall-active antibiotics response protein [Chloroflexota bacterium]
MRTGGYFWGALLVLVGVLLLLSNFGLLASDSWNYLWPLLLIILGVWALFAPRRRSRRGVVAGRSVAVPLGAALRASLHLRHGAGRLQVQAGANPGELVSGTAAGGANVTFRTEGDLLQAEVLGTGEPQSFPARWEGRGYDWSLNLSDAVPLTLRVETGASETRLDLSALQVTHLELRTGASSTEVVLPAHAGSTRAHVQSGAASVRIRVPEGVGASIKVGSGLAAVNVDTTRFPRVGEEYRSLDYGTAASSVDLQVDTGVGAVSIS